MLNYFKSLSKGRGAWFLLLLSCLVLEGIALYFQHGMGLVPCVMCIYERVALFGIGIAGLIGVIAPRFLFFRFIAIIVWIFSAVRGLQLAIQHTDYQLNPSPWNQCAIRVDFPSTLPLNEWFPNVFEAGGSCSDIKWQMFGYSMPQWLILAFAVYLAIAIIVLLSQFKRSKETDKNLFR